MVSRVVVVGASGFGRECLDVLDAMVAAGDPIEIVGVLDDAPSEANLERLAARGVPYLGALDAWLRAPGSDVQFVLGIGSPPVRELLVSKFESAGLQPFAAVHPSATFGETCELAEGIVVCAGAVISNNVRLGRYVHINPNATIGHDSVLEDFVSVNPAAVISGEVLVERQTLVGASATVLQNLNVGGRAVVGAGAVVTKDVARGSVMVGVPARALPECLA